VREMVSGPAGVAPTVVFTADDVLLSSFASSIVSLGSTTAVFVRVPLAGLVPVIVIVAFDPALTAPPSHVTVVPATAHVKRLVPEADTPVMAAGTVSTTRTFVAFADPMLFTVRVYVIGELGGTVDGPFFAIVRSARGLDGEVETSVVAWPVDVNVCAERVPVAEAVLLIVVPSAAVTTPRIVPVHVWPPLREPTSHVTRVRFCVQLPWLDVRTSCGGTPIPPTPLSWSVTVTFVTFDPPVLRTVTVYRISLPEATGSGASVTVTASGLAGSPAAGRPMGNAATSRANAHTAARRRLMRPSFSSGRGAPGRGGRCCDAEKRREGEP